MGMTDYEHLETDTVLIKINTPSDVDFYVNFNRRTSFNSETVEGEDQVLVTVQGKEGRSPSPSTLLAKLSAGGSYDLGSSVGTISVGSINTAASPGYADVSIVKSCTLDVECWSGNNDCSPSYCDLGGSSACERGGNEFGCNCNGICSDAPSRSKFINCGGPTWEEDPLGGNIWESDEAYVNDEAYADNIKTDYTGSGISGTDIDTMFQTDRYDRSNPSVMAYNIPLENGLYTVHLYFR